MEGGGSRLGMETKVVGGECLHTMQGRSLIFIRLSHPYNGGTGHVEFSPTRHEAMLAPSTTRREVYGEPHERVSCIVSGTACEAEFLGIRLAGYLLGWLSPIVFFLRYTRSCFLLDGRGGGEGGGVKRFRSERRLFYSSLNHHLATLPK